MKLSLNQKAMGFITLIVLVITISSMTFLFSTYRKGMVKEITARGTTMAESLSRAVAESLASENLAMIKQVQSIVQTNDVVLAQVYSSMWIPIDSYPNDNFNIPPDPAALKLFKTQDATYLITNSNDIDFYTPVYYHRFEKAKDRKYVIGYVRLKLSTRQIQEVINRQIAIYFAGALVFAAIAIIILNSLVRKIILKPIIQLNQAVSNTVNNGSLMTVDVSSDDEIGELSRNYNLMSEAIQEREKNLRLSEEKFSTSFRVSPDSININRLSDGMYLEVNEGFAAFSGYMPEDVIGKSFLDLDIWVNPEDRTRLGNGLKERGIVNSFEAQFRRKDGTTLTGCMSARIFEIDGEPCILSITRDITERIKSEEYIRENEKTLQTLMDSMPAGVWWFDDGGNICYLNRCFKEQFGYTLEDIPTLADWFERAYPDPEYRAPYVAAKNALIADALNSGMPVPPREAKITCKDGIQRHLLICTQFAMGRTIEIFTDITERELYHDQLLKVEKLESLGVLAGGIAHDFNNLLTAIIGNISFARTFLSESHKTSQILMNAEKAANRAADLAHQLLTFAKGGQPIKKVVCVKHILEESASFVLRGSNVSCNVEIPDDLYAAEVDEGQISQVFNNIIINATHAMPGGGLISIKGKNTTVNDANIMSLPPGWYIKIAITDTGCGISTENLKKIFDPYFTTKSYGSGLGLASAHSIITKHEGYIGVSSEIGKGTTFEILLPASAHVSAYDDTCKNSNKFDQQEGLTVLVMDDEEIIRAMVSKMMVVLGYQVQTCANGDEAITLYKAAIDSGSPYSAVIMDLTIPGGMGGREAAEHILAIDSNARLIVSSGYSTDHVMAEYGKFGFCSTLQKPYNLEDIKMTLNAVLS
ncbi:MAG: PAS domain S-box protein [Oryzomonas sp.]|uniref:PAS domain S-box protein n=1 Tax=Oryzomonas sp. TaxID=2855186 RepID=UPI00284ACFC3|nr:PAS domain S-box protein [Oryzomonas sp.]MDR3580496.1 PAS domain S-box protein [Oryzomonas sp.]